MKTEELQKIAQAASKHIKTEQDLAEFQQRLTKVTVEAALNAELDDHLGYARHEKSDSANYRNGFSSKTVQTDVGQFELNTPRDRKGDFEPRMVKKGQRRFTAMDDNILFLYAQGMTTRESVATFREMYGADVSASLVSSVTDAVIDPIVDWQSRPLAPLYPIVYLDGIVLKIRQDKRVINPSVYLALGINLEGHKALLGLWLAETEGSKFWLSVLTERQHRGVKDILIACVDGLKGFPDAIASAYPQTQIQLCIVHMVRNSLKFIPWKDYKAVTTDLKKIYPSATEEQALGALQAFSDRWDQKYPRIHPSWRSNWENLNTLFEYPPEIRKAIYTTHAIESLNRVIRKATQRRRVFPTDDSARKVIDLAIQEALKKWSMPIRDWKPALNRFMILFEDRVAEFI